MDDGETSISSHLHENPSIPDANIEPNQTNTTPTMPPPPPVTPRKPASDKDPNIWGNGAPSLPGKALTVPPFQSPLQPSPHPNPSANNSISMTPKQTPKPKPQYTKSWNERVAAAMESARQVRVREHEGDGDVDGFLEMMEGLKVPEHEHEPEPRNGEKLQKDDVNPIAIPASATIDSTVPPVVLAPPSAPAPAPSSNDTIEHALPSDADQANQRETVTPESTVTAVQLDSLIGVDVGIAPVATESPDESMIVDVSILCSLSSSLSR
jgi:hypothetical protein